MSESYAHRLEKGGEGQLIRLGIGFHFTERE